MRPCPDTQDIRPRATPDLNPRIVKMGVRAPSVVEDAPVYLDPPFREAVLAAVPRLRAFAISLCRSVDHADDLVQETLLRALANIGSFQPGTNMPAWLFTILRNQFHSEYRKRRREVEDIDGSYTGTMTSPPEQVARMAFRELRAALGELPANQREALILVGASGFTYEEAGHICGCALGTIKSRVNRARTRLAELMSIKGTDDFGLDQVMRAVLVR
jgi:RNA polymerase sigma-70 factor (ECF subfamily)